MEVFPHGFQMQLKLIKRTFCVTNDKTNGKLSVVLWKLERFQDSNSKKYLSLLLLTLRSLCICSHATRSLENFGSIQALMVPVEINTPNKVLLCRNFLWRSRRYLWDTWRTWARINLADLFELSDTCRSADCFQVSWIIKWGTGRNVNGQTRIRPFE